MPYLQASDRSVIDGLTNTVLLIGTPLEVICMRNLIHSWRTNQCHSWIHCGPHSPPLLVSGVAGLRSIVLEGCHVMRA